MKKALPILLAGLLCFLVLITLTSATSPWKDKDTTPITPPVSEIDPFETATREFQSVLALFYGNIEGTWDEEIPTAREGASEKCQPGENAWITELTMNNLSSITQFNEAYEKDFAGSGTYDLSVGESGVMLTSATGLKAIFSWDFEGNAVLEVVSSCFPAEYNEDVDVSSDANITNP